VRRVARRLGGLAGNACLLGVSAAACCAAAGASGAPARFELTIVATTHADWDHTTAPVQANGCTTSERSEGFLTVHFRTRHPVRVSFVDGRIVPADVGPLDGTATLTGPNTFNQVCGTSESHTPQYCSESIRTFRGVKMHVSSAKAGRVTLGALRLNLRAIECPREPAQVRDDQLGPVPGPLKMSTRTLSSSRFRRITLTASASRRVTFGPLEQGTLQQRTSWRLTFVRIRP
jgi:hypothetical protein